MLIVYQKKSFHSLYINLSNIKLFHFVPNLRMLLWDSPLAIAHGSATYAEIPRDIVCFDQSRAPCHLIQIEFGMILKKVLYFFIFLWFYLQLSLVQIVSNQ